jgi:dTDP-glucose 4,6-dehydratase
MHELGWAPQQTFQSAIRRTIHWYLDHQDWVNAMMSDKYSDWIAVNYTQRDAANTPPPCTADS